MAAKKEKRKSLAVESMASPPRGRYFREALAWAIGTASNQLYNIMTI
jgi:hypothetical protein